MPDYFVRSMEAGIDVKIYRGGYKSDNIYYVYELSPEQLKTVKESLDEIEKLKKQSNTLVKQNELNKKIYEICNSARLDGKQKVINVQSDMTKHDYAPMFEGVVSIPNLKNEKQAGDLIKAEATINYTKKTGQFLPKKTSEMIPKKIDEKNMGRMTA